MNRRRTVSNPRRVVKCRRLDVPELAPDDKPDVVSVVTILRRKSLHTPKIHPIACWQRPRTRVAADDNQWATQLGDQLLAIHVDNSEAKQIKVDALTNLARNMVNATARNYYLTVARELREELKTE